VAEKQYKNDDIEPTRNLAIAYRLRVSSAHNKSRTSNL